MRGWVSTCSKAKQGWLGSFTACFWEKFIKETEVTAGNMEEMSQENIIPLGFPVASHSRQKGGGEGKGTWNDDKLHHITSSCSNFPSAFSLCLDSIPNSLIRPSGSYIRSLWHSPDLWSFQCSLFLTPSPDIFHSWLLLGIPVSAQRSSSGRAFFWPLS